ncbi:small-conductance mechanosensitive ion channel/ MscS family [Synechococcus sp. A15-28]|nr:small-conductance mechanosensitive ion channel/ MscS family [Synechococcus sp. A15-28]
MFRFRRRLGLWLTAALLALMPLVAQASILDFIPPSPAGSPAQQQDRQAQFEGKYELAKVRVLGVPAITVASPVQLGEPSGIEASLRARVIEGNLRALYDPNQLCSFGERLSEWMLDRLLQSDAHVCTAGQRYGLDRSGTPLTLEVLRDGSGPYQLAARLPGREQPFPLLTVTRADAEINGARELALAQAWRERLEGRLNHARRIYAPPQLARRFRLVVVTELMLLLLFAAMLLLWRRLRQRTSRLHGELRAKGRSDRRGETRLHAEQALTIAVLLLLLMLYLLVLMIGVLVVAIPGKVPLGIELVLQPSLAVIKFLAVTLATFLLRSLSTFLLSQWSGDVDVPRRLQARRQQRYRSLLSTTHRLINVVGIGVVLLWVLLDVPGVRSASVSLVLAGGALLGALAFVFQGLLRDFSAGLVMLLEDRYAVGDWIEVAGIEGEVIEMGLFSTQIRCLDQRMNILDNSSILQMRNHTKLRSGSLVTFVISHRQTDLEIVYRTLSLEIEDFCVDPVWGNRLLGDPILRGIKRTTALGVQMQVLLVTRAGEQWTTEREFQRRALRALHRRGVQLADGLDLGSVLPGTAGGR